QSDWQELVETQANDWGGIVNLPALHKSSIIERLFPESLAITDAWLKGAKSGELTVPAKGYVIKSLNLKLPNDIQPATYPARLSLGERSYHIGLRVREPISFDCFLPNGVKEALRLELVNRTSESRQVSLRIFPSIGWQCDKIEWTFQLAPSEKRRLDVPIAHINYVQDHQESPIEVELHCEDFVQRWRKDFYVGYCFNAQKPPTLDGTFRNWNTSSPLLIDSEEQISRLLYGNRPWRGTDDLSAKVYAMYDDEYFYVGAEVTDNIVSTEFDPKVQMPSDFDSIEVILDTRVNGEQGHDPPTSGVFRHVAMPGFSAIHIDENTKGDIPVRFRQIKDAEPFGKLTDKGYNIIVRIPWRSLPLVRPEAGMKIGFDVAVNDNDGTRFRTNQMLWAGFNQNQTWLDLSLIGALIFKA
ncbi:MAG: sugar-binding protein, partial [Bacteroidota bacterium]